MGYQAELEFFTQAVGEPVDFPKFFLEYVASTRATLKAAAALRSGQTQEM
jgi:hypothetical protein